MQTAIDRDVAPARGHRALIAYTLLAWVLVGLILAQVFFAGMALFDDADLWDWHVSLGQALQFIPLLLLGLAFAARLPVRLRWMHATMAVLAFIQGVLVFIDGPFGANVVAALHPVNALAIFWLALTLAQRATALMTKET